MSINSITCPNCGASLVLKPGQNLITCIYCNSSLQISAESGVKALAQGATQGPRSSDSSFRMTVEDVFSIRNRGTVVTGRVASGTLRIGDQVVIRRGNTTRTAVVSGIEMARKILDQVKAGDTVGVLFKDLGREDVQPGDELVA